MERTAAGCVCPDEQSILPCKKEELQCDNGLCLLNWLRCHYKKDCSRDYMSIKITCSKIHSNQSGPVNKYPVFTESTGDPSLLVSPLLVAGVVIGLVLFLSCVTIIVGSLRKDGRLRNHPHLRRDPTYAPDGFSYGGSVGELRSTCIEEFPPAFDFGAYMETLSQVNVLYPDSPPGYEECVGPGSAQIYIPTEDPPPYSLNDPCQDRDVSIQISAAEMRDEEEEGASLPVAEGDPGCSIRFPQRQAAISTIALETAPPYETVVHDPNVLLPLQSLKSSPTEYQTLLDRTV
ncbi:protein BEAN1 [Sarcophilus harrisii]|uniref:Brain expressed associated with NEDD4 1 n=1 Tax=Sarcophilus harrisii TaxID=9305 RepID=A0A7N4NMW8_SARHA|nr:protein BEAN1 [Sarcophilus harrisii]